MRCVRLMKLILSFAKGNPNEAFTMAVENDFLVIAEHILDTYL